MKALSIHQPHAEAIMRGLKLVENQLHPTKVRGRIYVYACRERLLVGEDAEVLEMYGMTDVKVADLPRSVLVGTVELWDCTGSGGNYHWHFRNPERAMELLTPTKRPGPSLFDPF
jgi:hypothetical protein